MTAGAIISILVLVIVLVISCFKPGIHPGVLGVAFSIIVAGFWVGMKGTAVLSLFPVDLFTMLFGVTYLFSIAQVNGTMPKLAEYSIRLCKGKISLIPLVIFFLSLFFSMLGPGSLAAVAMIAPIGMTIAGRIKLSPLLLTILVGGAANAGALSPFAPAGLVSNGLMLKLVPQIPQLANVDIASLGWQIHWNSVIVQGFTTLAGFFLLGGVAWMAAHKESNLDIDDIAPKTEPFTVKQIYTLIAIATLIVTLIITGVPSIKPLLPMWFKNITANIGTVGFILAAILLLLEVADTKKVMAQVPWSVLMMVCGITVLTNVMDKAGGLKILVNLITSISTPITVNGWLGLFTGIISAYSSSSGVVMPTFLPLVPGLMANLGGAGDPVAMISSINIGAHMVDTSPLSTVGAICIACAPESEDKTKLFRNLLIWGLSMSVVGAIVCVVFFGVLGL